MFDKEIKELKEKELYRQVMDRETFQGRMIRLAGREVINFSSNDYLGYASDPSLVEFVTQTLRTYGLGAGASRLLAGGTVLHESLEKAIAHFKGTESAMVLNSGYSANTGAIPVLAEAGDEIFSDELNHASIVDGCRLSKAKRSVYRHGDMDDLRDHLKRSKARKKIIITDTIFSMDGDIAPLKDIIDLGTEESAIVYLDDAHGFGVLGNGAGALNHFGLEASDFVIQMGTLSKSFGSFGAYIAADRGTIEFLINRARSFLYSTALPAVVVAAAKVVLDHISSDPKRIMKLWSNVELLHRELKHLGLDTGKSETQIVPVLCESNNEALRLADFLLANDIYAPVIRPPTVKQSRIRISITALHNAGDISVLIDALGEYFGK
jgi:8-amino-7-oxononanoate synthase